MSGTSRRHRRRDPHWRTLRDLLNDGRPGPTAAQITHTLFDAGVTSPEKLRRMTPAEVKAIEGLGAKAQTRVILLRKRLDDAARSSTDTDKEN
jgi:hypothetical protein